MRDMLPLPVIIDSLDFQCNRKALYEDLIIQSKEYVYPERSNNFPIKDPSGVFDNLYTLFLNRVLHHFPNIKLSENNSRQCWGYASNKDNSVCIVHNHIKTASINVYYLSQPYSNDYNDGAISFYSMEDQDDPIFTYRPRINDLILFPGWLYHSPKPSNHSHYRIAINMEILVDE